MTVINIHDSQGTAPEAGRTLHLTNVYLRMFCHRFGLKLLLALAIIFVMSLSLTSMTQKGESPQLLKHFNVSKIFHCTSSYPAGANDSEAKFSDLQKINDRFNTFQNLLDEHTKELEGIHEVISQMTNGSDE